MKAVEKAWCSRCGHLLLDVKGLPEGAVYVLDFKHMLISCPTCRILVHLTDKQPEREGPEIEGQEELW